MSATLKETAYQTIREKLISGHFPPGSRLSDDSIAREIGISRSPVREAINQFVSEGLVEYRPRCGTYVRKPTLKELDDLWGVRVAMESFAVVEAVDRLTEASLQLMKEFNSELLVVVRDCRRLPNQLANEELKQRFLQTDSCFHLEILNSAGNDRVLKIVQECRLMMFIFGATHSAVRVTADMMLQSQREHDLIIKAIENLDHNNAREWVGTHIRTTRARVMAQLEQVSLL
ncbi:putative HTH-type transcriptional regulator YdfH [Polystyrenella longa]|uniref:Putative HTH-type transcriptional regulator YdfH n=1 Tax=Polystyrenella longa TaxID=2528007 RepID=A0A518CS40_9PLAN|nr:GntR family transcriptional regulator [Polystyrenella longa]QDU82033.1 putative HTH-type transcriptional regulator YdfH [Polystyrenella longa]